MLGDSSGGSVGAVGGAEGVVYEDIGELAEGGGEGGVICRLACVEADVFEQEDVAGRVSAAAAFSAVSPTQSSAKATSFPSKLGEALGDWSKGVIEVLLAFRDVRGVTPG